MDRKSHNLIRYDKLNKLKELGFTTSWNINEQKKNYNALEDPHADRYFRYQSVKMHMKELRRSLNRVEKNQGQKKRLAKLIKQKLSDHLPAIKVAAETYNIKGHELNKSQVSQNLSKEKLSRVLNKQKSLTEFVKQKRNKTKSKKKKHHQDKNNSQADISVEPVIQAQNEHRQSKDNSESGKAHTENNVQNRSQKSIGLEDKKETERKEYIKKQQELLHKKRHEEFISFIAKKRQTLESANK